MREKIVIYFPAEPFFYVLEVKLCLIVSVRIPKNLTPILIS